jgi:hypothetical protein
MMDPLTEIRRLCSRVPPGDALYVPRWDLQRYARAIARPADAREIDVDGIKVRPLDVLNRAEEGPRPTSEPDDLGQSDGPEAADTIRFFVEAVRRSREHRR